MSLANAASAAADEQENRSSDKPSACKTTITETTASTSSVPPHVHVKDADLYDAALFTVPRFYQDKIDGIVVPLGTLHSRIAKMAETLYRDYQTGAPVHVLCTLKGASRFFEDLTSEWRQFYQKDSAAQNKPAYFPEFIKVSSYAHTESGEVTLNISEEELKKYAGRKLLIVEDLVDTGKTLSAMVEMFRGAGASVKTCVLCLKRTPAWNGVWPDYLGFSVGPYWLCGYGVDCNQIGRDLDHMCSMSKLGQQFALSASPE